MHLPAKAALAVVLVVLISAGGVLWAVASAPGEGPQAVQTSGGEYVAMGPVAVSGNDADLGRVPLNKTVVHAFRIRNTSEEPLRLGRTAVNVLEGC